MGKALTSYSNPAFSIVDLNTLARSMVSWLRSVGSNCVVLLPASMREKSSSVFTSLSNLRAFRCAVRCQPRHTCISKSFSLC